MIISLDTETTGLDFAHGAKPFLVTTCDEEGVVRFWEWDVDPLTRQVDVLDADLADIAELTDAADLIYLQGAKFDAHALASVGLALPWEKVRDTLCAGHLLSSNTGHSLDELCIDYLDLDILKYETAVKETVQFCRQVARREHPHWRIAEAGAEGMPSVKGGGKREEDRPWKNDMWLPRALYQAGTTCQRMEHWLTACSDYANPDSEATILLGLEMERRIRERGLWKIYEHRLELPRVYCEMESCGLTAIGDYTERTIADYTAYCAEAEAGLRDIAVGYGHDLELADGAALNDNMRDFFYGAAWRKCDRCGWRKRIKHWNGEVVHLAEYERSTGRAGFITEDNLCPKCLKGGRKRMPVRRELVVEERPNLALPVIRGAKTGNASLDKDAMAEYLRTLDGPALDFIRLLSDKRKRETDLSYMESYRRFWVPVVGAPGYFRIHPSINPFGTDHLRAASSNPNLQNVSVQEEECEECDGEGGACPVCGGTGRARLSVRRCFGPAPGREWWDMDFKNLEKRIPVYECGEKSLIEVFERPDEPPYWGSDHNVLASLIFPEEFWPLAEVRDGFKKKHLVKYKRVKNTNFAKQYGAGRKKVDATAGVVGAFDRIERGLPEIAKLQASCLAQAERYGYVETLPDRTVDPARGYPLLPARTESMRVLSTTPFNYRVSGTACWVKNTGLVRCAAQCAEWRREGFDAHVALEVHDSILFDFPRGRDKEENKWSALVLKGLMERGGPDLVPSIPTPVSVEYVVGSWAEGVAA